MLDGERTRWGTKGSGSVCVQYGVWTVLKSSKEMSANDAGGVETWDAPDFSLGLGNRNGSRVSVVVEVRNGPNVPM